MSGFEREWQKEMSRSARGRWDGGAELKGGGRSARHGKVWEGILVSRRSVWAMILSE